MARSIDADEAKRRVIAFATGCHSEVLPVDAVVMMLNQAPTVDAVSRGVHEQVRWERDVAIEQLESYGISLGEKADVVKVVRCRECKYEKTCSILWESKEPKENGYCSLGERKENG